MIKKLILFLIVLVFAVWLGLKIRENPGYLLLAWGHWTIETPLWVGILLTVITFIIIYWLLRLLGWGLGTIDRINRWQKRKKLSHAHALTNEGLIALAEGDWSSAEKKLQRSLDYTDTPLINCLASAYAAQEQGIYQKRDVYLRQAHDSNPEAKIAIGLTQAKLQLEHHQLEQALATLKHLRELVPHHKLILKLLQKIYLELKDWQELKNLLPMLRKQKILSATELNDLEQQILLNILNQQITAPVPLKEIQDFWHYQIPKRLHANPEMVEKFVNYLISQNALAQAEQIIREALKKNWDSHLIKLYSDFIEGNGKKQLTQAEHWLKSHKTDASLFFTLGRLSLANQLWGKAKSYLEASIILKPSIAAYRELALLCKRLHEDEKTLECYQKAVALVQKDEAASIGS